MGQSYRLDPEEGRQRLEPGSRRPLGGYQHSGGADAQIILNMGWEREVSRDEETR